MNMPIDREALLKQLKHLESEIQKKFNEIKALESVMKATKALLVTYEDSGSVSKMPLPPTTPNIQFTTNHDLRHTADFYLGSKIVGGTSIDALKLILSNGPLTIGAITEKLLEMGHFRDNVHPKSSVHVTLSRRNDLFDKMKVGNEVRWKLKK